MPHLVILIDGDMFVYRSCASVEHEICWGNDIWTAHVDLSEAKSRFSDLVDLSIEHALNKLKFSGDFKVVYCFSSPENFRKTVLPAYKANRTGKRKPIGYRALCDWVKDNYQTQETKGLEADDCIGILATMNKGHSVIISGDKDLKTIPTFYYDFIHDMLLDVSVEEAMRNFYTQALTGDAVDGYTGCPKIGKVTAQKLLDKDCSWKTVLNAYKKAGLSEEYALQQARVARILWDTDYDFKRKEVKLWTPTD